MRSVAIAEWLLGRYAGEQSAWSMMGDLLEQREQKGEWWFWRSYSGMLIAVAWRPVLAFVAALFGCAWAWRGLMTRQIGMVVTPELEVAHFLAVIGWFVVMYSGVRYGLRDMLTQLAGIVTALATTAIILCRHELSLLIWTGTTLGFVIACAVMPRTRRPAMVFVGTGAAFFAGFLFMAFVSSAYVRYALHIQLLGSEELRQHPSIGYVDLALQLIGQAVTAWICKEMHRLLMERRRVYV
jgi:hypothetical protein